MGPHCLQNRLLKVQADDKAVIGSLRVKAKWVHFNGRLFSQNCFTFILKSVVLELERIVPLGKQLLSF